MSLDVNGEIIKLARELEVEPAALAFLAEADRDDVHRLRLALEAALDERNRGIYRRIEASSRLLPMGLSVRIAMASFPPLIVARVSEEIPADRSVKLLEHIPVDYMADCLVHMNPARAVGTVRSMPMSMMAPVIIELVEREEFVTLGRFLGVISDEQIPEVLGVIEDGKALILTGFHDEDPTNLDKVVAAMSDRQIENVLRAVADEDLGAEFAAVSAHTSASTRQRYRETAASFDDGLRERLGLALAAHGLAL